jgi:MFS family permease
MKQCSVFSTYKGLNRSIYVLFAARVVNRIGDFVQLFLVLFLTQRMGFSESAAGRFLMLTGAVNALGMIIGGYAADRYNRKRVLVFSQSMIALFYLLCGFYTHSMVTPWLISISSIFRGATRPVTDALVIDLSSGLNRKKAFSLLYLGTNIGVAIGPVIAGSLYTSHMSWLFWGDAVTTIIAAAAVMFFIDELRPGEQGASDAATVLPAGEQAEIGSALAAFFRRPVLVFYVCIAFLISFVYSQHGFTFPLQLERLFPGNGAKFFGNVMTFNAVIVLLFTALVTRLTVGNRPLTNMALSAGLFAVGFGMNAFIVRMPLFMIAVFFWTIGEILMVTNSHVFVANHTPVTHRARFSSIISLVEGSGAIMCPWITGILLEVSDVSSVWLLTGYAATGAGVGFLLLSLVLQRREVSVIKIDVP